MSSLVLNWISTSSAKSLIKIYCMKAHFVVFRTVSDYRAAHRQHQVACEKEELFTRQGHNVKVHLIGESLDLFEIKESVTRDYQSLKIFSHLQAPRFSRYRTKRFNRSLRFIIDFSRVQWHSERSDDEINQRKPEVKCSRKRRHIATIMRKQLAMWQLVWRLYYSMEFNSWTQIKNRLFEIERIVMKAILSSTKATKSQTLR